MTSELSVGVGAVVDVVVMQGALMLQQAALDAVVVRA